MKRFAKYLALTLATVAAVACNNHDEGVRAPRQTIRFTAEACNSEASRAGYLSEVGAHWEAGDEVYLYLSKETNDRNVSFQLTSLSNDRRVAVFEAEHALSGTLVSTIAAVYKPSNVTGSGGLIRIAVPTEQNYAENGYKEIPLVGTGKSSESNGVISIEDIKFQSHFAILRFNLTSTTGATITSIVLEDGRETPAVIAEGDLQMNPISGDLYRKWTATPTETAITLNCGGGITLSEEPTAFHIAVPTDIMMNLLSSDYTKAFDSGLKVRFNLVSGSIIKTTPALSLAPNTIYNLPTLALNDTESLKIVPDATFRSWLLEKGYITTADDETGVVTIADNYSKELVFTGNTEVTSLKGVEYFTKLTKLRLFKNSNCTDETIDISQMADLAELYCYGSNLKSLDVSKNTKLTKLRSHSNYIESLDISALPDGATLQIGNQKNSIKLQLYIRENQSYTLESSNNTNILNPIVK